MSFEGNLEYAYNSTIWRNVDVRLRQCVDQVMFKTWKWWVHIVYNFGGRSMSGLEVIEEGLPVAGSKTKPGLNRVKVIFERYRFQRIHEEIKVAKR